MDRPSADPSRPVALPLLPEQAPLVSARHFNHMSLVEIFKLSGGLNPDRLSHAVAQLCQDQAALRTIFVKEGINYFQLVSSRMPLLELRDCGGLPIDERSIVQMIRQDLAGPSSLEDLPIRFVLYKSPCETWYFGFAISHLVSDVKSISIIWDSLDLSYAATLFDFSQAKFDRPPVADYVAYVRKRLQSVHAPHSQLRWSKFWASQLGPDSKFTEVPSNIDGSLPTGPIATNSIHSRQERHGLPELARSIGVTPFAVLMAVWIVLLRTRSSNDTIVTRFLSGARPKSGEQVVALQARYLPLVVPVLSDRESFVDLARRTMERMMAAMYYGDRPWYEVLEALQIRDVSIRHRTMSFNMVTLPPARDVLFGLPSEKVELPYSGGNGVECQVRVFDSDFYVDSYLSYCPEIFSEAAMQSLVDDVTGALERLKRAPGELRLADLMG